MEGEGWNPRTDLNRQPADYRTKIREFSTPLDYWSGFPLSLDIIGLEGFHSVPVYSIYFGPFQLVLTQF